MFICFSLNAFFCISGDPHLLYVYSRNVTISYPFLTRLLQLTSFLQGNLFRTVPIVYQLNQAKRHFYSPLFLLRCFTFLIVVLADGSKSVEESFVLLLYKYRGSMNRIISILFHPRTRKCPRRKSSLSRKDRYLQWSTHVLQKSFIIMLSNEQTRTFPLKSTYYQNSSLSRGTNLICCHVVHTISPWPFRPESKCTFGTPLLQSRTMKRAQQIKRR